MGIVIPKRISQAILSSLSGGVVPRIGLEYIAVGRVREIQTALEDFENVAEGAAAFRFIIGRYGSGKTFYLQALRNYALERDFICADADLSPDKKLSGSSGTGQATYRELMQRLSTKLRPEGGALEALLQKWVNKIEAEIIQSGYSREESDFALRAEWKIHEILTDLREYMYGFDFVSVLSHYFKAFLSGDDEKKDAALRWIRGEYATRTEAKRRLPAGEIITDNSWYDHLKLFAAFSVKIGYRGLLVFIDEGVNLYKITNRRSRENNYEKLLSVFNDIVQGKAQWMSFYMGGTPQFLDDERRGLAGYPALKSRLEESRFVRSGHVNSGSPVIRLSALTGAEIFVLLERLTEIHALHYGYEMRIKKEEIAAFLDLAFANPGAQEHITPREITRDYLALLNILKDQQGADFYELIQREDMRVKAASPEDMYARFSV